MSDVSCPYCGEKQEINHDDGYGYEEGEDYEQACVSCEKVFKFQTSISFDYQVFCEDEHNLENSESHPDLFECTRCHYYELRR